MQFLPFKRLVAGAFLLGILAVPQSGMAQGAREIQVAGRTLGFLENAPSGRVTIAIVFDSSKPASVAEKDEIMGAIGSGMAAGTATVVGKAVDASAVAGTGDVAAMYLTHGVNYAAVGATAKSRKIITMSADMACVTSGACVMGVAADPKVAIVVNHATASAIGVAFKAAFKMMIKEI